MNDFSRTISRHHACTLDLINVNNKMSKTILKTEKHSTYTMAQKGNNTHKDKKFNTDNGNGKFEAQNMQLT